MKRFFLFSAFVFSIATTAQAQSLTGYENFHEIDKGKFYRSAQLSTGDLYTYVQKYGIKTVINLRGENPNESWYREEVFVLKHLGVQQVDIGMSAGQIPHRENLIKLLDAYANAQGPILVHCKAGADRTGEASAIYQMVYMGKSKEQAKKMLGIRYGHLKAFKPAKDYFIETVWQGMEWAYNEYDPCSGKFRYYDANNPNCGN